MDDILKKSFSLVPYSLPLTNLISVSFKNLYCFGMRMCCMWKNFQFGTFAYMGYTLGEVVESVAIAKKKINYVEADNVM